MSPEPSTRTRRSRGRGRRPAAASAGTTTAQDRALDVAGGTSPASEAALEPALTREAAPSPSMTATAPLGSATTMAGGSPDSASDLDASTPDYDMDGEPAMAPMDSDAFAPMEDNEMAPLDASEDAMAPMEGGAMYPGDAAYPEDMDDAMPPLEGDAMEPVSEDGAMAPLDEDVAADEYGVEPAATDAAPAEGPDAAPMLADEPTSAEFFGALTLHACAAAAAAAQHRCKWIGCIAVHTKWIGCIAVHTKCEQAHFAQLLELQIGRLTPTQFCLWPTLHHYCTLQATGRRRHMMMTTRPPLCRPTTTRAMKATKGTRVTRATKATRAMKATKVMRAMKETKVCVLLRICDC